MRAKLETALTLTLILVPAFTFANPDVEEKMQKLKTNIENSRSNEKQYRRNHETSSKNIDEINKALDALREQRVDLRLDSKNVEKNKQALEQMKQKVLGYKKEEADKLAKEEARIKEVRALLNELETLKMGREQNMTLYDQKIADIEKEKADWDVQIKTAVEIEKEINRREQDMLNERKKWTQKKDAYKLEADKWAKQASDAEVTYKKYNDLK